MINQERVAVVALESLAQAVHGTGGVVGAHTREGGARVLEAADELKGGVDVVAVENWLVDVLEPHRLETGALERRRGGLGVAE